MLDEHNILAAAQFQKEVWAYYRQHGRHDLPWRQAASGQKLDPYHVLVSEIMLQQTQVSRVIPKYCQFLAIFPDVTALAAASLGEVLRVWSGLGYNRRAKFLWQAAAVIMQEYKGHFPQHREQLVQLPGVGVNTAGAVLAYAFNQPAIFVETNIRTVFIHYYFHAQAGIPDRAILELVGQTLDRSNPREWYWALMDYGSWLKQTIGNVNHRSKSYVRQSAFAGSRRQLRGQIIRLLGKRPLTGRQLRMQLQDARLPEVIDELLAEQLIQKRSETYYL